MIPYDSMLIDPFVLVLIGYVLARLLRGRPARTRQRLLRIANRILILMFWATSVALYLELEATRWLWELARAQSGRDWMINSGVFHFEFRDPPWTTHLVSLLIVLTYPFFLWLGEQLGTGRRGDSAETLGPSRWRGTAGRTEVWYATFTDRESGDGGWLHYEVVAPVEGPAFTHGWAAWFPTAGAPVWRRFGPMPVSASTIPGLPDEPPPGASSPWFRAGDATAGAGFLRGSAEDLRWDIAWHHDSPPLYTFSPWLWNSEALPASQVVPAPTARFTGTFAVGGRELRIDGPGNLARIFGHGNALRWTWLHADLGDGDVLEVVTAVSRRPGLNQLPPLPFVQLRVGGSDWPGSPFLAALVAFRGTVELPRWTVEGTWRGRRLRVEVELPPDRCVAIGYKDPDGATATCTNTERANAHIVLERNDGGWKLEREWILDGTAHAEVGLRP